MDFESVGRAFVLGNRLRRGKIQSQGEDRIFYDFFNHLDPLGEVGCIWVHTLRAEKVIHSEGLFFPAELPSQQEKLLEEVLYQEGEDSHDGFASSGDERPEVETGLVEA